MKISYFTYNASCSAQYNGIHSVDMSGHSMNLTDATIILLLAARIHGTDDAVRASAKSVVKKIPHSQRYLIYQVISSQTPLELVNFLAEHLDD